MITTLSSLVLALAAADSVPLSQLKAPDGFEISVFASGVDNARAMALGDDGTLYVGSRRAGKLHAIPDRDGNGVGDEVILIDEGLALPSGLAWVDGSLYVAALDRILRYDGLKASLKDYSAQPVVVLDGLPTERHHGWKYLEAGPDGKLYFGLGAPCNICNEPGFANIQRVNLDGTGLELVAEGVRNTVGLAFHPVSGELWFTDNGRDMMGDDVPPDELNRVSEANLHFGYPYCHGASINDPEFGNNIDCSDFQPPVQELGAHVAPLGLSFYSGTMFPERYRNQVFIPEHGSWNRSSKVGYRISLVTLQDNRAVSYEPFITGWLQGEDNWGRPADIFIHPDGSMLISDDQGGVIYRVTYQPTAPEQP
ncbi:MAG: sorbosone dehydrogenase [Lysobacteraceae bacterium]|nr:MAG: sorbosone dehydrogenase [Xanthomonadaceae bacterium]